MEEQRRGLLVLWFDHLVHFCLFPHSLDKSQIVPTASLISLFAVYFPLQDAVFIKRSLKGEMLMGGSPPPEVDRWVV